MKIDQTIEKRRTGKAAHGSISKNRSLRIPEYVDRRITVFMERNECSRSQATLHLILRGLRDAESFYDVER